MARENIELREQFGMINTQGCNRNIPTFDITEFSIFS